MSNAITARTRKVGLIGWPVDHSFSPRMHNAAFRAAALDWVYLPLPVPADAACLRRAVDGLRALGFAGANVTIPHKLNALRLATQASETARAVGAANTLTVTPAGDILGDNTDAYGFLSALEAEGWRPDDGWALILGAGGAARSVVFALTRAGCLRIALRNRTADKARRLWAELQPPGSQAECRILENDAQAAALAPQTTLVVNATSVGMHPRVEASPLPADFPWRPGMRAYDLVYNPLETRFLAAARAGGAAGIDGLEMLLRQGARAFELWTAVTPDLEVMRRELRRHFTE